MQGWSVVRTVGLPALAMLAGLWSASPALADENGASIYLLGSGGPNAAILPPLEGVYVDTTFYVYDAGTGANRAFDLGGNIVANIDTTVAANFTTLLVVPSTNFLGGTLALGAAMAAGAPMVRADATITGPGGNQITVTRRDSALVMADPLVNAELGWKSGKTHFALSGFVNVPIGFYRKDQLANLAFHRWAEDVSGAVSWHDPRSGWDVSGKVGFTFNGENHYTDYDSGNDLHLEASAEKTLSKKFTVGVLGYHFQQISDDSGAGAKLGAFRGRVSGAGGTASFNTVMGRSPATFRLRIIQEFGEKNRASGTSYMLSLDLPLHMKTPTQAPQ
jgi:hypothetical protein